MGFPVHIIHLIQELYKDQSATVKTEKGLSDMFPITKGVRQGCILSPYLFNIYGEYIMRRVLQGKLERGLSCGGEVIKELRYTDDTTLLETIEEEIQLILDNVKQESEQVGLYLNVSKIKMMVVGGSNDSDLRVDGQTIEEVSDFNFLGSIVTNEGDSRKEVDRRIGMGKSAVKSLRKIWSNRGITKGTKCLLMRTLVFPLVTYACETWTMKARERARVEAFEMYAWRSLLSIHWAQRRTNASVLLDMGPHRGGGLLQFINTMQLRYFGHVARRDNNNLEKNCMLGMMEGDRRRGRPRMRWTDGIKKLTGKKTLHEAISNAQRREVWNVVIADCQK